MKAQKTLNKVLVVLIIILISLVSFGGIYYKDNGQMVSRIPNYILDAELQGYRQIVLTVHQDGEHDEEEHNEEQEAEGENTTSENTTTENVTSENSTSDNTTSENGTGEEDGQAVNEETNSTTEDTESDEDKKEKTNADYKKAVATIKKRLKSLYVQNYSVTLDENTGKVTITLPENNQTDIILSDITEVGKFSIKDSETKEELLNNSDVRDVTISLGRASSYSTAQSIVMTINFNNKGASKFKKITQDYHNVANETNTSNETSTNNETEDIAETNESNNTVTNETTDENKETKKQITIAIDSSDMLTTDFDEVIENGSLSLTIGAATDEFETQLYSAYNLAAIIKNEPLEIEYHISGNSYVGPIVQANMLKAIIYVEIAIALVILLVMIVKYRQSGIFRSLLSVGYLAIMLIIIRYANVSLSLQGILAIGLGFVINTVFNFMILKAEKEDKLNEKEKAHTFKQLIKTYSWILAPILIVALVCCFTGWASLISFGNILFWGIIISWIYNILGNKFLI